MDRDGRHVRRLQGMPFEAQYPAWSPDGRKIAFTGVTGGSNFDLYVVDEDGSNLHRLTRGPAPENWATWSPDAERIAFSIEDEIWVVNVDGSDRRLVTTSEDIAGGEPSWSPDGRWIAFDCSTGAPRICAIRPDGSRFTELFGEAAFPVWMT